MSPLTLASLDSLAVVTAPRPGNVLFIFALEQRMVHCLVLVMVSWLVFYREGIHIRARLTVTLCNPATLCNYLPSLANSRIGLTGFGYAHHITPQHEERQGRPSTRTKNRMLDIDILHFTLGYALSPVVTVELGFTLACACLVS